MNDGTQSLDRSAAYLGLNMPAEAEADADQAIRLAPLNFGAYNKDRTNEMYGFER